MSAPQFMRSTVSRLLRFEFLLDFGDAAMPGADGA